MSDEKDDRGEKQEQAIAALLARVPATPPSPLVSTQWVESERKKTAPDGLY
jgi:hypothetical protein